MEARHTLQHQRSGRYDHTPGYVLRNNAALFQIQREAIERIIQYALIINCLIASERSFADLGACGFIIEKQYECHVCVCVPRTRTIFAKSCTTKWWPTNYHNINITKMFQKSIHPTNFHIFNEVKWPIRSCVQRRLAPLFPRPSHSFPFGAQRRHWCGQEHELMKTWVNAYTKFITSRRRRTFFALLKSFCFISLAKQWAHSTQYVFDGQPNAEMSIPACLMLTTHTHTQQVVYETHGRARSTNAHKNAPKWNENNFLR